MKSLVILVAFIGITVVSAVPSVRLDSFKVYDIEVQNEEQLKNIRKLSENLDVHFSREGGTDGRVFEVVVPPQSQEKFEERLRNLKYKFEVTIQNLQERLEELWAGSCHENRPKLNWTAYHSLDTIYNWLDLQVALKPKYIKPVTIGYSYENRPIKAIKYSQRKGNKAIFIDSNIHAIEWISSAATTCFFERLLNSKHPELRRLAENYDWIFVPVVNPDGLVYTKNVHPLWRKNRKPTGFKNESGICYGVDLNRNFNYHWKEAGWNIDVPCDHWYAGSKPDSEPEVIALQRFLSSFPKGYIRMYSAVHSYGNLVLLPYGHTTEELPPNIDQLNTIAKGFATEANKTHGTEFRYGPSALLGIVSGAAKDWTYGKLNIPYTSTIELRDTGKYGFFLPADQILPVCEEFTAGIIGSVKAAEKTGLFR